MECLLRYLSFKFRAAGGSTIVVTIDRAANVQLLDDANFRRYQRRAPFQYRGGHFTASPIALTVPTSGIWHVVIDTGGRPGTVHATVELRPAA